MNISKISDYSPNFQSVRKSAAKRAIDNAGSIYDLLKIRDCVELQKNNIMYDVYADDLSEKYVVCECGKTPRLVGPEFDKFEEACSYAGSLKDIKIVKGLYNEKQTDISKAKIQLISQIMSNCIN